MIDSLAEVLACIDCGVTAAVLPARQGVAYDYASLRRVIEERLPSRA